jgi:hypothetical protein
MIAAMPMKRPLSLSGTIVNSTEMVAPFLWSAALIARNQAREGEVAAATPGIIRETSIDHVLNALPFGMQSFESSWG